MDKRLAQWAKTTQSFEPLGDALFQPAVRCDLAGQLMVRGREAKLVKLAAASAPYAFLDLPWAEALQAFTERVPQRKNELERLLKAYAQRSDEARKLALEQIQKFVKGSLERHIAEGGTYGDFADDLEAGKESLGISTADPAYLKMVFRTNVQSAYGAGRFRAITDPDVIELRPYVQYRTVGDARVRPEHAVLDRTIYHAASPEWHRISPPNSFNCRCSMCSLSRDEVVGEKVLGQVPANYVSATPEFDSPPTPHLEPANDNAREMKATQLELAYNPTQSRASDGEWTAGGPGAAQKARPSREAREKSTGEALQRLQQGVVGSEVGRAPIDVGVDAKVASRLAAKTKALSPPPPKVAAVVGGTAVAKKVSDWSSRWVSNTTKERAEDAARALTQPGSWAQHQYAATQSILKEHMADLRKQGVLDADGYLTLYRGASGQQAKDIQRQVAFKALHPNIKERPSITVHPVTSWSASPLVAKGFAGDDGVVIKQKIHASRVFASHLGQSGRWNSWDEQEFAIVHPERTLPLDNLLAKDAI